MAQLKERLQPYVDGERDNFLRAMAEEADKLAESTFGVPMLKTIGYAPSHRIRLALMGVIRAFPSSRYLLPVSDKARLDAFISPASFSNR